MKRTVNKSWRVLPVESSRFFQGKQQYRTVRTKQQNFLIKLSSNLGILWMLNLLPLLNNFKLVKNHSKKDSLSQFYSLTSHFPAYFTKSFDVSRANLRLKSIRKTKLTFLILKKMAMFILLIAFYWTTCINSVILILF